MDNEENLLSVLGEKNIESLLTPQEALKIQSKLWDILAGRAESYTMGGSSSVRVETAQELLRSAGFVLRHGINAVGGCQGKDPAAVRDILLDGDYAALFRTGLEEIGARVREGEALLKKVEETATAVENTAYSDTLKELGVFFKRYHYHHFAHDIPCMIDYPLAHPVDEALLGIDYVGDYLRRLLIENDLCGRFDPRVVTLLLKSVAPDYKENLLNIYEAVASNALALALLGGDIGALDVTDRDRSRLASLMGAWTEDSAAMKLRAAAAVLIGTLDLDGEDSRAYLEQTAAELYVRVKPMLSLRRLEHIFPPLYREKGEPVSSVRYIDGALMDDERLRDLIDTLTSCGQVTEKIALARQNIGSLRDWAEVLGICFWGRELPALFASFSAEEIDLLLRFVREKQQKYPEWISETGWEKALIDYTRGLS